MFCESFLCLRFYQVCKLSKDIEKYYEYCKMNLIIIIFFFEGLYS